MTKRKSSTTDANSSPASKETPKKRIKTEPGEDSPPNTEERKVSIHNTLYDEVVFIEVGPQNSRFAVHKGLLTKESTVFREILQPKYEPKDDSIAVGKDGSSTVVILKDDDPITFTRVHHWLYSKRFLLTEDNEKWPAITWQHLVSVYLFSVRFCIPHLHNACIDATIIMTKNGGPFPNQNIINALYKIEVKASPLRSLFVKLFATKCDLQTTILTNRAYHSTFLNWLVIEMYNMQKSGITSKDVHLWTDRAAFYTHGPANPLVVH